MRKVGEVLRLAAEGFSHRQISRSVGLARSTVSDYLERAQRAGIGWPLPAEFDSCALEMRLFPAPATVPGSRPEPQWRDVHRELKRKRHVTLQWLWLEFREFHPDGWAYSQFCVHYRRWLGLQHVVMRLEYRDGERLFIDFSGDTMGLVAPDTGEITVVQVFVAVLGPSGYIYVEATRGQDLPCWLGAHVRALEFYGGSPAALVPDNLKSGVTKACWYDPEINPSYLELAHHYGTVVLPTIPGHPRDKAICVRTALRCAASSPSPPAGSPSWPGAVLEPRRSTSAPTASRLRQEHARSPPLARTPEYVVASLRFDTGRFPPDRVAGFDRNRWPISTGTSGRFHRNPQVAV